MEFKMGAVVIENEHLKEENRQLRDALEVTIEFVDWYHNFNSMELLDTAGYDEEIKTIKEFRKRFMLCEKKGG